METLQIAIPTVEPQILYNISPNLRTRLLSHITYHRHDCNDRLVDYSYDIALVWRAFSDPEKIGFLTHERFNRLLTENILDVPNNGVRALINHAKESPEGALELQNLSIATKQSIHEYLVTELTRRENEPLLKKYGQMTKPGRIIRKLRPYAPTDNVEAFATAWKAEYEPQQTHVSIIDDVPYAYNSEHYQTERGTIMSCMTNELRYVQFYNHIGAKAAILKNQHGQILARAIYWPSVNFTAGPHNVPLIDRVYVSDEHHYQLMFEWAASNGIYRKEHQNYTSKRSFIAPDQTPINSDAYVPNIDITRVDYYPYMDTFTWYDNYTGRLVNDPSGISEGLILESTSGSAEEIGGIYVEGVGTVPEDDVVYDYRGEPILFDDAVPVGEYYYHTDSPDIVRTEEGIYILESDSICTEHGEYYHVDNPDLVETTDGLWYHVDDPEIGCDYVFAEDTGRYVPKEDTHESIITERTFFETESSRDRYDDEQMNARDRQLTLTA